MVDRRYWKVFRLKKTMCSLGPRWLEQCYPTFLTPVTGFVEDNFPMDRGEDGSGGNASDGEQQTKLHSLTCCVAQFLSSTDGYHGLGIRLQGMGATNGLGSLGGPGR